MRVTIRTYTTDFIYLFPCTDTGVIATHTLSFYQPLAPLSCWLMRSLLLWLRAAPYCTLLRTVTYCSSDAYCSCCSIVLLQYLSQACWVLCSPRLDFFHCTVISTLVAANRRKSPFPLCLIPFKVIHCNVPKWHALVNYFSSETIQVPSSDLVLQTLNTTQTP